MKQVNKNEIVKQVSERTGVKREVVSRLVNETFTVLREIMSSSDSELRIGIRDFGSFEVCKSGVTSARNPQTNEKIKLGPRMRVRFSPGQYLKENLKR